MVFPPKLRDVLYELHPPASGLTAPRRDECVGFYAPSGDENLQIKMFGGKRACPRADEGTLLLCHTAY